MSRYSQQLLAACVVGGGPPDGNPNPCETIHLGCVEAWQIDEESGATAAGVKGVADLALTGWDGSDVDLWWNQSGDDDSGRMFFGGIGIATLSSSLNLLKTVGSAVTVAQRRWYVGASHTQNVVPPGATPFGDALYSMFRLEKTNGPSGVAGARPPRLAAWPQLGSAIGGGRRSVVPGPFYRVGGGQNRAIEDSTVPGCPPQWPPFADPVPYLVVVTAMMVGPNTITFSAYGAFQVGSVVTTTPGVCFTTPSDGDVPHDDGPGGPVDPPPIPNSTSSPRVTDSVTDLAPPVPSPEGTAPEIANAILAGLGDGPTVAAGLGAATNIGELTRLYLGGTVTSEPYADGSVDTLHQAAIWDRALTPAEVAWLGANLDKLFASIATPESQCGGGSPCTEESGPGTANPLLTEAALSALSPTSCSRIDRAAIARNAGDEVRETRSVFTGGGRVYVLTWENDNGRDLDLVREALRVTRNGAISTKWRHPIDDAAGTVCAAPDWRIVATQGVSAERNKSGHVGAFSVTLEEQVR